MTIHSSWDQEQPELLSLENLTGLFHSVERETLIFSNLAKLYSRK